MLFDDLILYNCRQMPETPAILLRDRVLTFRMLGEAVLSAAAALQARGVRRGHHVGLAVDTPDWQIILTLALYRLGAAACPSARIDDFTAAGVRLDWAVVRRGDVTSPVIRTLQVEPSWFSGRTPMAGPEGFASPDDICRIALSSGTTGRPKPIAFTARSLDSILRGAHFSYGQVTWERMLMLLGPVTNFGLTAYATALGLGRAVCFARDPAEAVRLAALFRLDGIVASNNHLETFLEAMATTGVRLPEVRFCFFGGSQTTARLVQAITSQLCPGAQLCYGSTERGVVTIGRISELDVDAGAAGRVTPWCEVEAIDSAGNPLPAGETGVLRVRTPGGEPYGNGSANTDFDADGWHYPGDTGRITPDGMLYITGRTDHLINAGGVKIAPEIIEDKVRGAPGVRDVAATMLDGDRVWLVAAMEAPLTRQALLDWCATHLARPDIHGVVVVPDLPRSVNGKIRREDVKDLARAAAAA